MQELNTTQSVHTIEEDGFDTLTAINLGEAVSLAQVAEDGSLHNIVIGLDQAEAILKLLNEVLG